MKITTIIKISITFFCLILSFTLCAQDNEEAIFYKAHQMPRFEGCENIAEKDWMKCIEQTLITFVEGQLNYPTEARENGIEGLVIVNFIVEKDGTINNPRILRDIGGGCGEEALRIVRLMPDWIPGQDENGNIIRVQFNFPIMFELENEKNKFKLFRKKKKRRRG